MCSDTARSATTPCAYPNCNKPVWRDPDGSYSLFCGLTHMRAMANVQSSKLSICKNCKQRPVYVRNGQALAFCGQRCAKAFALAGRPNPPLSRQSSSLTENRAANGKCVSAGCMRPVFVGRNGVRSRFCSNRHRRGAVTSGKEEGCLLCTHFPKEIVNGTLSNFCSKQCSIAALARAPIILPIPVNHRVFREVVDQFTTQWRHPSPLGPPTVQRIWKILNNQAANDNFSRYQLQVERRTGLDKGNTCRRWHGTVRACSLGDDTTSRNLCLKVECSLCNIVKSSFQLAQFGRRTNFGRFGAGLYTSATSSKANDYVQERMSTTTKAMLLNKVVLGKTKKLTSSDPALTQPPTGYDSVIGEPGGDLNYDESIVYTNDAIRPSYLVIYSQ